ncbi:MAG: VWA domain-containing protein [Chloroflexi bacterium]|nr:VWA domain-containing protein [Chloroflexota bacterium]
MQYKVKPRNIVVFVLGSLLTLILISGLMFDTDMASQAMRAPLSSQSQYALSEVVPIPAMHVPTAPCAGGPTIDGIILDECHVENFNVGGNARSITVWYTKNTTTATRVVDGITHVLEHWINTDAQAQQVATWGREAWLRYFTIYNRDPYNCSGNVNVRLEEGIGWSGIARWNSSDCNIGIDAPMVRNNGGQGTTYHEFQHFIQRSYNNGCFGELGPNYPSNSEYVEGYADLHEDVVDAALDATGYGNSVAGYDPETSFFDKGYNDVYSKYYAEQVGSQWTPADPHHHMDAVRDHYLECDVQDTIYVLDDLIPSLTSGVLTQESLFMNFFAANWSKDWADPASQPTLVYTDDDGNPYGQISLAHNVTLASGTQSYLGETTPDDWAGRYYQVRPQAGCDYITIDVDGAAGARLGINLIAADTVGTSSVSRAGWIGEDFTRTFPAWGVHDQVAAVVNAFANTYNYDVSFTCVSPTVELLEPKPRPNHTQVGDPTSPIAFLTRFKVTSGGTPVLGLLEASFSGDAEGDTATFVAGSFQEVGEEYWVTVIPPTKAVGTTYSDFRVCLDSSVCDANTDALLYVDPGNSDFIMLFDASGSMKTEDVPGEGARYINARKAATVMADLLRTGDRVGIMDFGAYNNPVNCGLPYGDGNCAYHIVTQMPRTDVIGPGAIDTVKTNIGNITWREEWTPIGQGLREAKNEIQAAPYSLNPKVIILLSDGQENVNPLYNAVQTELINSGVIIDTIGLSSEAPEPLLAQIAADTGGIYRYVATTPGSMLQAQSTEIEALAAQGAPTSLLKDMATTTSYLPGPLALDNVYDYFETKNQGATRLFHTSHTVVPDVTWRERSLYVDDSVNTLRLVVAGKQFDRDITESCEGYHRHVEVLTPGSNQRQWIPVSPPVYSTGPGPMPAPPDWMIRNSGYDDVVIIPNPDVGEWSIRVRYEYRLCSQSGVDEAAVPQEGNQYSVSDFIINASVQSDYRLEGRFLSPIVNNKGRPGMVAPIVATLLSRSGAVPGATVLMAIERPDRTDLRMLYDDGMHSDGSADDGIYGWNYHLTDIGGTYNVRIVAQWEDTTSGEDVRREWLGAFWIQPPEQDDEDKDGMPDTWERRCGLDTRRNDVEDDPDNDDLINIEEFHRGTIPCDPDTDDGGEMDGSEVEGGRNPLVPEDDHCPNLRRITYQALSEAIAISWPRPHDFTNMNLYVSDVPEELGQLYKMGTEGTYVLDDLRNDRNYYLHLAGEREDARCTISDVTRVRPQLDPDPPFGTILINNGAPTTTSPEVVLNISVTDEPLPGPVSPASAPVRNSLTTAYNAVSGAEEMMLSNDPEFADGEWEPIVTEKPWKLAPSPSPLRIVYAKFRDAAKNESFNVSDSILLQTGLIVSPTQSTTTVSGTVEVELRVESIANFYGAQVELVFDPAVVEVVDAYDFVPGVQIEEGDFPTPDAVIRNQANNATGIIQYSISLQGDKPGVDGSGVLARIKFHGLNNGASPVKFSQSVLADPQSQPINHSTQAGEVIVEKKAGTVQGKVILERRNSNAGAEVCLNSACVNTANAGSYSFSDVALGNHMLNVKHMSYLRSQRGVNVPVGLLTVPDVTLLGGDINQDDLIEVDDGRLVGLAWNSTPGMLNWDERADITDDGSINVLDMVAVQFNWDEAAPGPWAGVLTDIRASTLLQSPAGVAAETKVNIVPSDATLTALGEVVELDIRVEDVTDLYAARLQLTFDPAVLQAQDADPRGSAPGIQIRPGDFLDPINQFTLVNDVDNTTGAIDFAVTQLAPAVAQDGSGVLATVIFEAAAQGTSAVHLESVRLLDDSLPEGVEIPTDVQDGQVTVRLALPLYLPLISIDSAL